MDALSVAIFPIGVRDGPTSDILLFDDRPGDGADDFAVTAIVVFPGATVRAAARQPLRRIARVGVERSALMSPDRTAVWCSALGLTTASVTPIVNWPAPPIGERASQRTAIVPPDERVRPAAPPCEEAGVRSAYYRNNAPTSRWMFCTTRTKITGGRGVG